MKNGLRIPLTLCLFMVLGAALVACRNPGAVTVFPATAQGEPLSLTPFPGVFSSTPTDQPIVESQTHTLASPTSIINLPSAISPTPPPTPQTRLWLAPYLPESMREAIALPAGVTLAVKAETANLSLVVGNEEPIAEWIYALVAPFPTVADGITSDELMSCWKGKPAGPFSGEPLLIEESTYQVLSFWLGLPAEDAVKIIPAGTLLNNAWNNRPAWAIIPFEAVEPRWKVLEVDGQSPLRKNFDPQNYILTVSFTLAGEAADKAAAQPLLSGLPKSNYDPGKLTTVIVTGVTAMVRATAWTMEKQGILYPAVDIRDWLREADILHISNEIPFDLDCPFPNPQSSSLQFCSNPSYIELLEDIGTDVVELTGDHFADYGPEATLYTLDLYNQRGWPYYGGGVNAAEARQPVLFEINGNKIAFLGCNAKGGGYATASETNPGAWECDFEYLRKEVKRLRSKGYLPIVTYQHEENENLESYKVRPEYQPDFESMAEAGAVVVSGSQAHQPLNFEFARDGLIHYGLGNLFFDQLHYYPTPITDRAFLDRHVFYDGHYLGVELLTIQFTDMAHSRPMTPEERQEFLEVIFRDSGW